MIRLSSWCGCAVLVLLFAPIAALWTAGPLVGLADESVAYRYYHTLRLMAGERAWVPQGQLLGLVHLGLQHALTLSGEPVTSSERLELWIRLADLVAPLLTLAAYVWAVRPLGTVGRVVVAALIVSTAFEWRTGGGYALIQPDYPMLCLPFSLVMLGAILRHPRPTGRTALLVGLFAGACLAVKPTWAYATPLGLALLFRARTSYDLLVLAGSGVLAALLAVGVLAAYYGGLDAVPWHMGELASFIRSAPPVPPVAETITAQFTTLGSLPVVRAPFALLLVPLMALSLTWRCHRPTTLALLLGLVLALAAACRRPEPVTWTEANAYAALAAALWWREAILPHIRRMRLADAAGLLLAGLLVGEATVNLRALVDGLHPALVAQHDVADQVETFVARSAGRTAYLIPDMVALIPSEHTARAKGGPSAWLDRTWSEVTPVLAGPERRLDLSTYDQIVIAMPGVDRWAGEAEARVVRAFGTGLAGYTCEVAGNSRYQVALCRRDHVSAAVCSQPAS